MGDYFDRIERQLVEQVGVVYPTDAAQAVAVEPPPDRRARRAGSVRPDRLRRHSGADRGSRGSGRGLGSRWAGVGLGGLGGLIAAVVMSLGASPNPEFTIVRGKGRAVTIRVAQASSLAALNDRLAAMGIPIRTAKVLPDCVAPVQTVASRLRPAVLRTLGLASMPVISRRRSGDGRALLSVQVVPPARSGQTLVLAAGGSEAETFGQVIVGSAPACIRETRRNQALLSATG